MVVCGQALWTVVLGAKEFERQTDVENTPKLVGDYGSTGTACVEEEVPWGSQLGKLEKITRGPLLPLYFAWNKEGALKREGIREE